MNIYHHLRASLHDALHCIYPNIKINICDIPLKVSSNSQYGDISSPIAKQIATIENISSSQATNNIIHALKTTALLSQEQNPVQVFALNEFINFKLNRSFINAKIISIGSIFSVTSKYNSQSNLYYKYPEIQKAVKQFLSSIDIVKEMQNVNMKLLVCKEELSFMKEIVLAEPKEIQTENSLFFFHQRLCKTFNDFYRLCPLYTSDIELTKARFLLIKAFLGRFLEVERK